MKSSSTSLLRKLLFPSCLRALVVILLSAAALAQTTTLTINSSTGLINVPAGVTPNFAALKLGGVSLTLPAGAIVGTTDTQSLTNKTYNGLTVTGNGGSLTVASGAYLVVLNQLSLGGNNGSTVSFGAGGTVAYTTGSYADPAWITSLAPGKVLPSQTGNAGKVLQTDGANVSWQTVSGGGSGTVTSVGLTLPGIFSVSGSPVTTSGTLAAALANQSANLVFAGPGTGAAAAPTFRSLVAADLPGTTVLTTGTYSNPSWITGLAWSKITGTPTTLSAYGITDPIVLTSGSYADPAWIPSLAGSKLTGTVTATNGVVTTGSYADPAWITSLAGSKLTGTVTATNGVVTTGSYADPAWIPSLAGSKLTGTVTATNGVVTTGSYADPAWLTSLAGSKLTAASVNLTTKVTGALPYANGGTNATTLNGAIANLGWSKNIVVLSARVTCDASVDQTTDIGTDNTSAVNTILATASASAPLWLIWDGTILTSAPLVVYSHTRIDAMPHCGLYLKSVSDCLALGNQLNGSSIANTDIEIRNLEINCNGNNQHKWEANTDLSSTTAGTGSTAASDTITYASNTVVAVGMKVTATGTGSGDIPASTYVKQVLSATSCKITNAATGTHSNALTYTFAFDGPYDRVDGWVYGLWFSGFKGLKLSGVTVRNAKTFSLVLSNGSDFVIEHCQSLWDDNLGIQTRGGGATNSNTTITYAADPGYGTGSAIVQVGYYVNGPGIPPYTTVSSVTNNTTAVISNAAAATATGLTLSFTNVTNNNRDGIHMLGNLDSGHIIDYYSNGDDDALAFNADESSQIGDARRGTGYAISNIVAENIQMDAGANGFRLFSENGTGTLANITIRNIHGTIISGFQSCSPPVTGTLHLGRYSAAGDNGLVSVSNVVVDGWDVTALSPAVTDLVLKGVNKLRLANIPEGTRIVLSGVEDYTGDRAPAWQRYSFAAQWGGGSTYYGWDAYSKSGGALDGASGYGVGGADLWSGTTAGNYAAISFCNLFSDPFPQGGGSQNPTGVLDWSIPFEAELQFQLTNAATNSAFRWLIGRILTDVTSAPSPPTTFTAGNGIGIAVINQELYLETCAAGTAYHLDTGYSVPLNKLSKVRLRNIGNGVVRVYVANADGTDHLVYSCVAADGPTAVSGQAYTEFHETLTSGSGSGEVILQSLRIKR